MKLILRDIYDNVAYSLEKLLITSFHAKYKTVNHIYLHCKTGP